MNDQAERLDQKRGPLNIDILNRCPHLHRLHLAVIVWLLSMHSLCQQRRKFQPGEPLPHRRGLHQN